MPVTQPILEAIERLWPLLEYAIPGVAIVMPLDAVVGIIDSVQIGIHRNLKVNPKFRNILEIANVAKETTEAILTRDPIQRREAIYSLLAFFTDVEEGEDGLSKEEFMKYARQTSLPGD